MNQSMPFVWRIPGRAWVLCLGMLVALSLVFGDVLWNMVDVWHRKPEYSHGMLMPLIASFLVWQQKDVLAQIPFDGAWTGLAIALLGILLFYLGELSTIYRLVQYAFVIAIIGIALALVGWKGIREIWFALFVLVLMVPLPQFVVLNLTAKLQLLSSQLGVSMIRLLDIGVFLEGNVADLGTFKMEVVEACSGLRYLFPLLTLGMVSAYFFRVELWKRVIVVVSTIPLTILMNSLRIAIIGVTAEYWGANLAEGVLHDFEGWTIYAACLAFLIGEMWLLTRVGAHKSSLRDVFAVDLPARAPADARVRYRTLPKPFLLTSMVMAVVVGTTLVLPKREEALPERRDFAEFPLVLGEWNGRLGVLEQPIVEKLKLTDYFLANFENSKQHRVNLYSAYYASQRKGEAVHSPRTCIPGGGWEIFSFGPRVLDAILTTGGPLEVNRAVVQKGDDRQLVYYWFEQRGRVLTNEYLVKWYLFWDALTKNRTDGALVRVTMFLRPGDSEEEADLVLTDFVGQMVPKLSTHIPSL